MHQDNSDRQIGDRWIADFWIAFSSRGRIGLIRPDGTGLRYLSFDVPGQVSWQLGPAFDDGRRFVVTSYEEGKPWEHQVRTHLYIYDAISQSLDEIATRDRSVPMLLCSALLPGGQRMVAAPFIDHEQRIVTMNLDGSDVVELTQQGEGFAYCVTPSPDGMRLVYHITGPGDLPYRICVTNIDGKHKTSVAHHPDHLYFGPVWSPDGEWLAYQDCHFKADPGHDWADLCVSRPDGSARRILTQGQCQWFGTSYGTPETRGGGSELPQWSPDGQTVTHTRATPGAQTPWVFQPQRPDSDHFNRDYLPEQARGGTQICLINPFNGQVVELTAAQPGVWDFRARWSPDGSHIAFSRARVGEPCELWIMAADGSRQCLLARGVDDLGADHARWIELETVLK
ncbi:MAG: serine/threonine protein kinase [Chloroflexi bacterium]|nr:serine/threonine protein kinase [Chloroflexota bacterium]